MIESECYIWYLRALRAPMSHFSPYTTLFRSGRGAAFAELPGRGPLRSCSGQGYAGADGNARDNYSSWRGMGAIEDRKSTRLNSSHAKISYAVVCWIKE